MTFLFLKRRFFVLILSVFMMFMMNQQDVKAQQAGSPFYTVIQAGGIYGVATTSAFKPMHGFQFQIIFGRNFDDKAYLGFGIGNDTYRGKTIAAEGVEMNTRLQTLPMFADFRIPLVDVGMLGKLGAFANAGYAPQLSEQYRQGALGKLGISYEHLLADRSHLKFSLGYGAQQFRSRYISAGFIQQQITLNIGLIVH